MHTPYPIPPGSAPGHKPQKPLKESGIIQSLGTSINFVFFLLKGRVKKEGMAQRPPTLYTLLPRSLRIGACERISSFKGN